MPKSWFPARKACSCVGKRDPQRRQPLEDPRRVRFSIDVVAEEHHARAEEGGRAELGLQAFPQAAQLLQLAMQIPYQDGAPRCHTGAGG